MATTRLADIIEPEVYASYGVVDSLTKTALWQSGIIVNNDLLNQKANTGGSTINVPFWLDLDESEPNISSDDPAAFSTPEKIVAGKQLASIAYLNKSYSAADLTGQIAGSDPMDRIVARIEANWVKVLQKRLISSCQGIVADNVANNAGDMVESVASQTLAGISATTKFSATNFAIAAQTMGDAKSTLTALAVHSTVETRMGLDDLIEFIPDSEGALTTKVYQGKVVIVDDSMPVVAGTTDATAYNYTSYLFGSGMFGFGEGIDDNPLEYDRVAGAGNGGGVETVHTRKIFLLHPFGFQFTEASMAAESATSAELELAANWTRVVARKNIPFAALITNGI